MSIRLRLTIFYVVLLAILLVLFDSFVYVLFERNMVEEIDGSLNDRANEMIRILQSSQIPIGNPRLPPINAFASGDVFIQLLDADGEILDRSRNLGIQRIPVDFESLERIARTGSDFETLAAERTTLRVFTLPFVNGSRVVGYVQVARPLDELALTRGRLRQVLFFGTAMALIVAFALGSLIAGRALRPIDRISKTARRIGVSGNLGERIRSRGPKDELGRLSETINEMLDRLENAYHRLEAALAAQRRFVADASHELRTPLTTVRGNLELLSRHPELSPVDREEALSDASSEARRMSRLVEDLLFLARADAGQVLNKLPISADQLIREVVRQARLLAKGQIIVEGPIVGATILASADHFKQLLLILVDNAIKYTPAGNTIRISAVADIVNSRLLVEIADSGVGISTKAIPHIFDRFFRADSAREGAGAGLGLSIGRWLAEEHGGTIEVQSTPGEGSTFTIKLPALSFEVDSSHYSERLSPVQAISA